MYQLNYHSKAKNNLTQQDVENILASAKLKNKLLNISGCLVYYNNDYVQILEGKKNDVLEVFEMICKDPRHFDISVLWENEVKSRYFSEWNMVFYQPESQNLKSFLNNMLLLSDFSEKSTASLLSFWAMVREIMVSDSYYKFDRIGS